MKNKVLLQTDSLLHIPLDKYENDFTFIVNSVKFKTNSFIADLLSPIISSRHLIDPTLNSFTIATKTNGDFNMIINLLTFKEQEIDDENLQFFLEVFEQLGTKKVKISSYLLDKEITNDNAIYLLKHDQEQPQLYKEKIEKEIEYISSHFYELNDKLLSLATEIHEQILEEIIRNKNLQLDTEEQLFEFINQLYSKSKKYSILYEFVDFNNVETESMKNFIKNFDMNDLTSPLWSLLAFRLQQPILTKSDNKPIHFLRAENQRKFLKEIELNENDKFNGILNYLQKNYFIDDEVDLTASSYNGGNLLNLLQYSNKSNYFWTKDEPNSWILF